MARPKVSKSEAKTSPVVTHVPLAFKKKIIKAAEANDVAVSEFVRVALERAIR